MPPSAAPQPEDRDAAERTLGVAAPPPAPLSLGLELRALMRLATPIVLTQIGQMLLGVVDLAVVGRFSQGALAGVGFGSTAFFAVLVLGFGWMLALDPLVAQAVGAGEERRARDILWQGGWVALAGTLPLSAIVAGLALSVSRLGLSPDSASEAGAYLLARIPGIFPFLALAAGRAYLQAHEVTRPLVAGVVVANVLNAPLTYGLVHGVDRIGLEPLGAAGAGWASSVATLVQLLVAAWALRRLMPGPISVRRPRAAIVQKILRLGTPIGLTMGAEVGSFTVVAWLVGTLGTLPLSAHSVTLTAISTTFQLAVSLGVAGGVRVGHAIGRGDTPAARRSGLVAIGAGAAIMIAGAAAFVAAPRAIARLVTDDGAVIAATVPFFLVAAVFQLSDGVQAVAAGCLRGAGDTRVPLIANLVGHYGVGLPLGCALTFGFGAGAVGLWWGLAAGLTAVALTLTWRFGTLSRREIARA